MSVPSPSLFVSVVLCAYNPRPDHLAATLESLRRQDLSFDRWELIVVDNHSDPPLTPELALEGHPEAQLVVEPTQGLAHARRRGYLEAHGDLIVHCDDDNVLAPDYLSAAGTIYRNHPHIGTFGGQLIPRFEAAPKNDLERGFGEERRLDGDRWSNQMDDPRCMPWGAGMCLRREVIDAYLIEVESDPRRLMLGRSGTRLLTGEDLDLNYVAVKRGYGNGLFAALTLEHFIPPEHLTPDHHIRYKGEANGYSVTLLRFLHFGERGAPAPPVRERIRRRLRHWRMSSLDRRRAAAWDSGVAAALRDIERWGWKAMPPPANRG